MIYEIQNELFIIEQSSCNLAQLGFLEELIDIGRASIENNTIKLPIDTVYHYKTDDDNLFQTIQTGGMFFSSTACSYIYRYY